MTLDLAIPNETEELRPKITVIGVGGAGGNAVNNMIAGNLEGVDFLVANTDGQALAASLAERKIQLGHQSTQGLGAGAKPEIGHQAALESLDELMAEVAGSHMVFIATGMGGGTGTGAAPVIAKATKEHGILTIGVTTKPFEFEGSYRMEVANRGVDELQAYVDTLIVIPNQNLFRLINERTTITEAFSIVDSVLHKGIAGITDLIIKPGLINLDFADIRSVMTEMGKAMMGTGEASSDNRAIDAAEAAIRNPLLDETTLKGAQSLLINVTGGADMTLFEADEAAQHIRKEIDRNAKVLFGATIDEKMEGIMRVSVVVTGMEAVSQSGDSDMPANTAANTAARPRTTKGQSDIETLIASAEKAPAASATSGASGAASGAASATPTAAPMAPHVVPPVAPLVVPVAKTPVPETPEPETPEPETPVPETPEPIVAEAPVEDAPEPVASAPETPETPEPETPETADAPFTLGDTAMPHAPEEEAPAESNTLMRHITNMFPSRAKTASQEREEPPMAEVKPLVSETPEKVEPILKAEVETPPATPPATSMPPAQNTLGQSTSAQPEPELEMEEQNDMDLEIPAFLRRQAN